MRPLGRRDSRAMLLHMPNNPVTVSLYQLPLFGPENRRQSIDRTPCQLVVVLNIRWNTCRLLRGKKEIMGGNPPNFVIR